MNIITKKARLVPAPFVGSILNVNIGDGLVFKLRKATIAEECDQFILDWGDGSKEVFDFDASDVEHHYPAPGLYGIKLSDGVESVIVGHNSSDSEYSEIYAPMVSSFFSNAQHFNVLASNGFNNCINLVHFDVSGAMVKTLSGNVLRNCSSLAGELYFPKVNAIRGSDTSLPFVGCGNLTRIHFALSNETKIRACAIFKTDPTLGTGVADICKFDL